MSEVLPEQEIMGRVRKEYSSSPLGWRMYQGFSRSGNPELLILGKENWHLRREKYSERPGIGMRLDDRVEPTVDARYAGLRPMPDAVMDMIMDMIIRGANPSAVEKFLYRSARRVVKRQDPVNYEELEKLHTHAVVQGPIMSSLRPVDEVIGGQTELDAKLDFELMKLQKGYTRGYIG